MADRPTPTWFRRRRIGFGWRPVTWQGWLITGVAVRLVIVVFAVLRSGARGRIAIAVLAVYSIVALATGGARSEVAPEPADEQHEPDAAPLGEAPRARPVRRERVAGTGAPAVVAEQLTKRFGERIAVNDVSFTV